MTSSSTHIEAKEVARGLGWTEGNLGGPDLLHKLREL